MEVGLASSVSIVPYARLNDDEEAVLQAVPVDHELTIHFLLFQSKKKKKQHVKHNIIDLIFDEIYYLT